jgi:hypothetical protein
MLLTKLKNNLFLGGTTQHGLHPREQHGVMFLGDMVPKLLPLIVDCGVIHRGDNLSIHSPIWVKLNLGALPLRKKTVLSSLKRPSWSKASQTNVDAYTAGVQERLTALQLPPSLTSRSTLQRSKALRR